MRSLFLIYFIGLSVLAGESLALGVEVVADGKHYGSVLEYKREKIKKILERTLSSINLQEFSETELCNLFMEVRNAQTAGHMPSKILDSNLQEVISSDVLDFDSGQIQEMLDAYNDEHFREIPFQIDPKKMKNVIIEPVKKPDVKSKN